MQPTPAASYTAPGQQLDSLTTALSSMPSMPYVDQSLQDAQNKVTSTISGVQGQYPTWARGVQNAASTQAGIPTLTSGVQDLSKIFPLYLQDQQLQQQYNPNMNNVQPTTLDQYTSGNAQTLLNNVIPQGTFGSGFSGFNTPSMATASLGVVPQSASNLIGSLMRGIGFEQSNIVNPAMMTASDTYNNTLTSLNNILGLIGQREQMQYNLATKASTRSQQQDTKLVSRANQLINQLKSGTIKWGDAWNNLNQYSQQLGVPDSTPDEIDSLLGGKYDPSDPTGSLGKTYGWAAPGAYQNYILTGSTARSQGSAQGKAAATAGQGSIWDGIRNILGVSQNSSQQGSNTVHVQSPDGQIGNIDKSELPQALQNGWKEIP